MKVLIAGGSGLLGPYLAEAATPLGPVVVHGRRSGDIQRPLADAGAVAALVDDVQPDLVFQCVALTDVDACERDPDAADALNRAVPAAFAAALSDNATLVQVSTDQVYPGAAGPYAEGQEDPVNVYGRTKLAGEAMALAHPNALALRVNFFGPSRTVGRVSLSDWMIRAFRDRSPMTLFTDSLFSPLHLSTLAHLAVDAVRTGLRGVYNLGSRDGISKADFGLALARHLGLSTDHATVGPSADLPGRAPRPNDMRMAVGKIEGALGREMPSVEAEIALLEREPVGETL